MAASRTTVMASTGVITRPTAKGWLYRHEKSRDALMPTIQSARSRQSAALYSASYSVDGFRWANPSRMAFSSMLDSHRRGKGFFVTELATTGGFLKEKNTTLLIGTDDHKLDAVLAILKQEAGLRKTVTYAATPMESGNFCPGGNYSVPIDTQTGGCTVFVLNMEQLEKF